jgi:tetratricopeptide (TPR) repeat protein
VASGALEAQRDGAQALRTAERLDESGYAPYRLSAEQTRGLFHAHQGNFRQFERCRQRAEQQAVQQGTSWQVETWAVGASTAMYMRMHDAMGMKQALEQLSRLSQEIPALDAHARRARGTYLLMRRKYTEALPWLEECLREEPRAVVGWARAHGILARAHNRLGNHEAARGVCRRALERLVAEDLCYSHFSLIVETELLIARAGLCQVVEARAALEQLLSRHAPARGPLTMGELHEAGLEIALLVGDPDAAQQHFNEMERWYRSTGAPSLLQRCEVLAKNIAAPQGAATSVEANEISLDAHTHSTMAKRMKTVDRMLAGGSMSIPDRAHKALQILAENCRCARGYLYLFDAGGEFRLFAALRDEVPEAALEAWVRERALREVDDDDTQLLEFGKESETGADVLRRDGRCYRLLVLAEIAPDRRRVVGAALLASDQEVPPPCPLEVSRSVGHHLHRALQREASVSLG